MSVADILGIVGLIFSVVGGAIGAFSILVTWKLYQAGSAVNNRTLELLAQVQQSSHTTEVTAVHYTDRLVGVVVEMLQRGVTASLADGERSIAKRIDAAIQEQLATLDDRELVERVRTKVLDDVKDTFQTLQLQTAAAAQVAEPTAAPFAPTPAPALDPGAPQVVRWVARNETKYEFFSVKFLRETIFATEPVAQRGLQFCISEGLLELYDRPNPNNPAHPTRCCRLNRAHPRVRDILRDASNGA